MTATTTDGDSRETSVTETENMQQEENEIERLHKQLTVARCEAEGSKQRLDDVLEEMYEAFNVWIQEQSRRSGCMSLALRALRTSPLSSSGLLQVKARITQANAELNAKIKIYDGLMNQLADLQS